MKKVLSFALAAVLLLLCACSSPAPAPAAPAESAAPQEQTATEPAAAAEPEKPEVNMMNRPNAKKLAEPVDVLSAELLSSAQKGDVLKITFDFCAEGDCAPVSVQIGGEENRTVRYYAGSQWSRVCLPLLADGVRRVVLRTDGNVYLDGLTAENLGKADLAALDTVSGQHMLDPFEDVALPETGVGAGETKDLVASGNYIYSIGDEKLTVTDVSDPNAPKVVGKLGGFGGSVRQIALCASGTDVFIVSRQDGGFIVDVSDPKNPRLRTRYDTLEYGTGISICGSAAFICNRTYGVEVVDLSDLDHPVQRTIIRTGEAQSCLARDGILYCGLWSQMRVDLYDIRDLSNITLLGSANLAGKGDGLSVRTENGRTLLYAATGQHSAKSVSVTDGRETDPNFGLGNGLDIFDVTDPKKPVWLSTSRIDGRFYFANNDYWEAHTAEAGGRVYAYLVNTYNGVYVFDVTEPTRPVRLARACVPIPTGSKNYAVQVYSGREEIFPYDQKDHTQSPIGAVSVADGAVYLAGAFTDLHLWKTELAHAEASPGKEAYTLPQTDCFAFDGSTLTDYRAVRTGALVHRLRFYGNRLFAACGTEGIGLYTPELTLEKMIPTEYACYDLALYGDTLYSAEGQDGVAAYAVNGTELTEKWRYRSPYGTVRSVEVSAQGKFLAIQAGSARYEMLNTETHARCAEGKVNMMYYRNIETMKNGRYFGFWGLKGTETWYDCGEKDSAAAPKLVEQIKTTNYVLHSGAADYEGGLLGLTGDGYRLYDPTTCGKKLTEPVYKSSKTLSGKPAISGKLMVVCNRLAGTVTVADLTDVQKPQIVLSLSVPGSPDCPLVVGDTAYIPCGQQGIFSFSLAPYRK